MIWAIASGAGGAQSRYYLPSKDVSVSTMCQQSPECAGTSIEVKDVCNLPSRRAGTRMCSNDQESRPTCNNSTAVVRDSGRPRFDENCGKVEGRIMRKIHFHGEGGLIMPTHTTACRQGIWTDHCCRTRQLFTSCAPHMTTISTVCCHGLGYQDRTTRDD